MLLDTNVYLDFYSVLFIGAYNLMTLVPYCG